MKGKRGFEMSFAWLFSLIVGAVILFLAIYFIMKFTSSENEIIGAKTSKELIILTNPLETSFESGKTLALNLPDRTRIYNGCNNEDVFGNQLIRVSQKIFNKWSNTNLNVSSSSKYFFSDSYAEGKKFYIFSKPFEFPFKVSDLIYLTSSEKDYCFKNAPEEIKEELKLLKQPNLLTENCGKESINVCFNSNRNCNVSVNFNLNYVEKDNEKLFFEGDTLLYAAIFSDKEIYECQLKRLMQRTEQLALLYNEKSAFISRVNCNSNLELLELGNNARDFDTSNSLPAIFNLVNEIKEKNEMADCKLW